MLLLAGGLTLPFLALSAAWVSTPHLPSLPRHRQGESPPPQRPVVQSVVPLSLMRRSWHWRLAPGRWGSKSQLKMGLTDNVPVVHTADSLAMPQRAPFERTYSSPVATVRESHEERVLARASALPSADSAATTLLASNLDLDIPIMRSPVTFVSTVTAIQGAIAFLGLPLLLIAGEYLDLGDDESTNGYGGMMAPLSIP